MKRGWTERELEEHWLLDDAEQELIKPVRTGKNRLGFALQLKFFQYECRFPRGKWDLPTIVNRYVARQLSDHQKSRASCNRLTWTSGGN